MPRLPQMRIITLLIDLPPGRQRPRDLEPKSDSHIHRTNREEFAHGGGTGVPSTKATFREMVRVSYSNGFLASPIFADLVYVLTC